MPFPLLLIIGLLFGIGFGFFAQRAGLCIAHGLGEIFVGKGKRFLRLVLTIFIITSAGFLLSAAVDPSLGLKAVGQLRGYGFYNIIAGICFGAGIYINGGCILGTLRQVGEGSMLHLISILCFIPGMAIVFYGLNPILSGGYEVQKLLLPQLLGTSPLLVTSALVLLSLLLLHRLLKR
ncbi:MAG: YeeE/YedE thiosulfate transporter family protein [Candidatus Sedimenticola sp. (ex Thyasira tokunagai)]